jgi:hypothetical protein
MIRFGLRLAVAGGREAVTRLVVVALAVGLGVGLLLATLSGINAVNTQDARYAWFNPGVQTTPVNPAIAVNPMWWLARPDFFDGQEIGRVDLAATGPVSPIPPGLTQVPGPGQYYASPKLSELLASTPASELADRFPGHQIGTIGPAALPAPNSLVIIIGRTPTEMSHLPGAFEISNMQKAVDASRAEGFKLVLAVVAAALLFPVLIFIGTAARLVATRREQRFAAMRLVGATPGQISKMSAAESTAAAAIGTAIGFGVFLLTRHWLANIPFTGVPFFPSDLSLNLADILLVALGVPAAAAITARLALRRVRISPLGVSRRVTPRPPRAYRLIPVAVGILELAYFDGRRPHTTNGQVVAFLSGMLVVMAGLVVAGPWLTMVGSRLVALRSRRPATLIAARRLADNPSAGFRSVSGLVLALFVATVAVGTITTVVANRGTNRSGNSATVMSMMYPPNGRNAPTSVPDSVTAALRATDGVRSTVIVHNNPDQPPPDASPPPVVQRRGAGGGGVPQITQITGADLPGVVSCADLARTPSLGRCAPGASVAYVDPTFRVPSAATQNQASSKITWPTAPESVAQLNQLPLLSVSVVTDGSKSALEHTRTVLETAYPNNQQPPATDDDFSVDASNTLTSWQQLANVAILTSLVVAGCSLAVSVAGGLAERKRPFSLLRLSGAPLAVLRRVVTLETAVPLLAVAVVAIGVGFISANLFLRAQLQYTVRPPGVEYYVIVVGGLAVCLGIIASTLPMLRRITGPETARNE